MYELTEQVKVQMFVALDLMLDSPIITNYNKRNYLLTNVLVIQFGIIVIPF